MVWEYCIERVSLWKKSEKAGDPSEAGRVVTNHQEIEAALGRRGGSGWELVTTTAYGGTEGLHGPTVVLLVFKRPVGA